ncbi:uncharacterized protein LOC128883830 isoform X2 [Hylaeus volcanicus]|uniref:uncharacterized protein LOC128883830 isoform X2 n=1 Tax=Hylaeus volcanicus TaxID=313075 RepID=UPI0023B8221A|nr:uncharacterized protein LOC128883830 isoform X2 [Hylaeus volcanicus]
MGFKKRIDNICESPTLQGLTRSIDIRFCRNEKLLVTSCALDLNWSVSEEPLVNNDVVWLGTAVDNLFYTSENFKLSQPVFNRYPGLNYLVRKRCLAQVLQFLGQLHPDSINFYPETYLVPEDLNNLQHSCANQNNKLKVTKEGFTYILKPDNGSQGMGLRLVNRLTDIPLSVIHGPQKYILQRYILNPMKLKKKKFDIRVYSLITQVFPELEAYIGTECLARFCTDNYVTPEKSNIHNVYMHYTNFSINKNSKRFTISTNIHNPFNSKRHFRGVLDDLHRKSYDPGDIWSQIVFIVQETLLALQPMLVLNYLYIFRNTSRSTRQRCFQIVGFDILLDDTGRAWLLEVNSNPSLRTTFDDSDGVSRIDHYIKYPLVKEALHIVSSRLFHNPRKTSNVSSTSSSCYIIRKSDNKHFHKRSREMNEPYASDECKNCSTESQPASELDVITHKTIKLLCSLKYWMPIAFPHSEKKNFESGIKRNKCVQKGKHILNCLRNKQTIFCKDSNSCNESYVCWAFVSLAIKRYWRTFSNRDRLLVLCRKIFERVTLFPRSTSINPNQWHAFTHHSKMKDMLSTVRVLCPMSKESDPLTHLLPLSEKKVYTKYIRELTWADLELVYFYNLYMNVYSKAEWSSRANGLLYTEAESVNGLSFWGVSQLLLQISALIHITQANFQNNNSTIGWITNLPGISERTTGIRERSKISLSDVFSLIRFYPDTHTICTKVLEKDPKGLAKTASWFLRSLLHNMNEAQIIA